MAAGKKPESIKKVEIGIKGDPNSFKEVRWRETGKKFKYFQGVSKSVPAPEMTCPAKVINRLNHQVILSYDGEGMVVPPNGRKIIGNYNKLGALPRGVTVVPLQASKIK